MSGKALGFNTSPCVLGVLCASVVSLLWQTITTEAPRTPRTHRETEIKAKWLCTKRSLTPISEPEAVATGSPLSKSVIDYGVMLVFFL
jgi:hypothetical protein